MNPVHPRARRGRPRMSHAAVLAALTAVVAFGLAGATSAAPGDAQALPVPAKIDGTTKGTRLSETDVLPSWSA